MIRSTVALLLSADLRAVLDDVETALTSAYALGDISEEAVVAPLAHAYRLLAGREWTPPGEPRHTPQEGSTP